LEDCIKERTFYFCYDLIKGRNKAIPIYLKKEGGVLSQFPIYLFFGEKVSLAYAPKIFFSLSFITKIELFMCLL